MWLLSSLLLLAAPTSAGRCLAACDRAVGDAGLRQRTCDVCYTLHGEDRGAWVLQPHLPREALEWALRDPDWQVRWGAIRALASAHRRSPASELAAQIASADPPERVPWCAVAARASPPMPARCQPVRAQVATAIRADFTSGDPSLVMEGMRDVAAVQEASIGRAALEAVDTVPPSHDRVLAEALLLAAQASGVPVGVLLVRAAGGGADEARMNRLLAAFAPQVDALRDQLRDPTASVRADAIDHLAWLSPLSEPELKRALADPLAPLRGRAAEALAKGEARTLSEFAAAHASSWDTAEWGARWVAALGALPRARCMPPLLALLQETERSSGLRAEAAVALGTCAGPAAAKSLTRLLRSKDVALRAGAVRGFAAMPPDAASGEVLIRALTDDAPAVLEAALDGIGERRLANEADAVASYLTDRDPTVRTAAARALVHLARPVHVEALVDRLEHDDVVAVRVSAATTLGELAGPRAVGALSEAAANDPDSHVRFVAREALHRLGFPR